MTQGYLLLPVSVQLEYILSSVSDLGEDSLGEALVLSCVTG